ncbi:MAG: ribulose-phosphate 3-epimerase [Puniceicoccales bacterium]|jgi:ribulose-phosphate 3-epimerase|nr:ribulose-phosphate 3-epimerase [Puniceicoccales bacterium]
MTFLVPSLLSCDHCSIWSTVEPLLRARHVHRIHFDVMDGKFVPNFGFSPQLLRDFDGHVRASQLPRPSFDVHLMVHNPEDIWPFFWRVGADAITFHGECCPDPAALARNLRPIGLRCGLALSPGSSLDIVSSCGAFFDELLLLGVPPGFGGQPADDGLVERVAQAVQLRRKKFFSFAIAVDGGVGPATIGALAAAGMEVPIAGSALFCSDDAVRTFDAMEKIFGERRLPDPR